MPTIRDRQMDDSVDERDISPRSLLQVHRGEFDHIDLSRVGDDDLGAPQRRLSKHRPKDGMLFGRVRTDYENCFRVTSNVRHRIAHCAAPHCHGESSHRR